MAEPDDLRHFRERLEGLIASSGVPLASLTPQAGLELMLRVYEDAPTGGCLSCSWGGVTRYGPHEFGFALSRWTLSPPDQTVDLPKLSLYWKVGPRATVGDVPGWIEWCNGLTELDAFRSTVEASAAFQSWGMLPAAGVAIECVDFESWPYALFDCWGVRDPSRPVVSMTEEEWLKSEDVGLMLRWFRQEWRGEEVESDRLIGRYLLACCRRIWSLLPQEESRAGVEVAERFANGQATIEELWRATDLAEGAGLNIGQDWELPSILGWCDQVARMEPEELAAILHSPRPEDDLSPRGLLMHAAFFVHKAMCYPGIRPKESIEMYRLFLPAPLLRDVVGNPFQARLGGLRD